MNLIKQIFKTCLIALTLSLNTQVLANGCVNLLADVLSAENFSHYDFKFFKKRSEFNLGDKLVYIAGDETKPFEEVEHLRIGSYNVLNLIEHRGKWVLNSETNTYEMVKPPKAKPNVHKDGMRTALMEMDLDIVAMQEVEGHEILAKYNHNYLADRYVPLLLPGNDTRGINIGFMVKKNLPFDLELHSVKEIKDIYNGNEIDILSRDLPFLVMRKKGADLNEDPYLIYVATHFKSKRDSSNDPESTLRRTLQAKAFLNIQDKLKAKYPNTPIMIGGDFNNHVHSAPEYQQIFAANYKDSLDIGSPGLAPLDRVTHTYHPRDGATQKKQIDAILVSPMLQNNNIIFDAGIYRYKDPVTGEVREIPETYDQRKLNPSDHFPIYMDLDFNKLRQAVETN